jgi:N-acetylneuraminate synthase
MAIKDVINTYQPETDDNPFPIIIAEAGVNHEGSMDIAKRLIDEACEGGAQAIKFQTYKAEKLASKDSPYYWDIKKESTRSQYELFKKYDKFWKGEYEELKKHCDAAGIEFLSTPFDLESLKFLNDLMDVVKISSSDLNNIPFIREILKYQKPVLLSTGASYLWEIQRTVEVIEKTGIKCCLLHCILNYPTDIRNANLGMINTLKRHFPDSIPGYSDHTQPENINVITTSYILGARIIEKHFTHDKKLPGNDHYHAMDKGDLKKIILEINTIRNILGSNEKHPLESEEVSRKNARRSLVTAKNISKGVEVTYDDVTWKRPGTGIHPENIDALIGKKALIDIPEDTILQWNMFE